MIRILGTVFAGLSGLAFGSFLNVCLSRWPAGESVVKPGSHCRACTRTLAWWENVPLLSWLALQGRCRTCGAWIGWRYPVVELAVGALWAQIAWQFASGHAGIISFSPLGLVDALLPAGGKMLLVWMLVGLAALDAEHLWLPDIVTLPGIALGVGLTLVRGGPLVAPFGLAASRLGWLDQLLQTAFAIVLAAGLILLIRWAYWLVRRREGIGLGDAKLMAMLAAWLGLPGALLVFAIGVVLGAAVGVAVLAMPKTRDAKSPALTKLPLGTFLSIGGIISALWGRQILSAYLRWSGLN
jgi:leader peptidase (prepilin peptidase)/N-methyltransferase